MADDFVSDKDFKPDALPTWKNTVPFDSLVDDSRKAAPNFIPDSEAPSWDKTIPFDALQDDATKYGGTSGEIKSFGLGAARSASFGLSDEFLSRTGAMKPEDIKAYREQNPNASIAGEIGGIAGALLAPEVEVIGALSAPVKGVASLGKAATEGAAALLPEATSTVGKILKQAGTRYAGSAVEGAFYGLGQSVTEHALGDPDLNAEKVLANVVNAALLGGALGGVLGGAEIAAPAGVKAAKSAVGSLAGKLADVLPENAAARAASAVSGKSVEDIAPLLENPFTKEGATMRQSALEGFKERETTARELADHLKDASGSLESAVHDYYEGPRSEEISKLMGAVPYERAFNAATDLTGALKASIKELRSEPEIFSSTGRIRQLELVSDALERKVTDSKTAEEIYHAINDAKGQIDPLAKFGKIPNESESATVQKMKDVRRDIRTHLENPAVYGEGGARQASLNEAYSEYAKASKDMLATFGKKVPSSGKRIIDAGRVMTYLNQVGRPAGDTGHEILQNYIESAQHLVTQMGESEQNAVSKVDTKKLMDLFEKTQAHAEGAESALDVVNQLKRLKTFGDTGAPGGAIGVGALAHAAGIPGGGLAAGAYGIYSTLKHPAELVRVLSGVERAVLKMNSAVDKGVKGIFDVAEATRPIRNYSLSTAYADDKKKDHAKTFEKISELNANPQKFMDRIESATAGIAPHAPQTAQGVHGTMIRAAQFLKAKMPESPDMGPFGREYKHSNAELSKWQKYVSIVNDPVQTLDLVQAGTLTADAVEALNAVYPKLYSEMRFKLLDQLSEHVAKKREPIPYYRRLSLSLFLGEDLCPSLKPQNILATQNMLATATMARKANEAAQAGRGSTKSVGKMEKGNRLLTSMQASAARESA